MGTNVVLVVPADTLVVFCSALAPARTNDALSFPPLHCREEKEKALEPNFRPTGLLQSATIHVCTIHRHNRYYSGMTKAAAPYPHVQTLP